MIFGFNTDVKHNQTIYHVQSEARKADLLLQTMVFVKGHCIGKYGSSYAEQVGNPGFSEEHIHDLLKKQHREVLDVIKAGSIEQFFRDQTEIRDAEGESLAVTWLNSDEPVLEKKLTMRLLVSDSGVAVDGAVSEPDGRVAIDLDLEQVGSDARDPVVFVRATHGERSVTRKYRLKVENKLVG